MNVPEATSEFSSIKCTPDSHSRQHADLIMLLLPLNRASIFVALAKHLSEVTCRLLLPLRGYSHLAMAGPEVCGPQSSEQQSSAAGGDGPGISQWEFSLTTPFCVTRRPIGKTSLANPQIGADVSSLGIAISLS